MVELIVVIVIIGILGAMASSRFFATSSFDGRAYADQLGAMLRFGQKVAIAQNRSVYARVNASGVALCYAANCAAGSRVLAPGGGNSGSATTKTVCNDDTWACEAPPAGVTVGVNTLFYFDPVGRPVALPSDPAFAGLTVQVGGSIARSITVERETGYVH